MLFSLLISFAVGFVLIRTFLLDETLFVASIMTLVMFLNFLTLRDIGLMANISSTDALPHKKSIILYVTLGIVLLTASIAFAGFFRSQTPLPTISGWDINSNLAYVNWIVSHRGFQYVLIPPFPNGITPYPAFFFYIVSYYSLFLGMQPYLVFWFSVYPLILGYMSLVFLIALKFSRNLWLSLISSFVAFFASSAWAEVVRNPLYLTLDMVSQLIFLLIISFNLYHQRHSKVKKATNIAALIFLALFNYYTVVVVLPFIVWIIVDDMKLPLVGDRWRAFRISAIGMAFLGSILLLLIGSTEPSFTYMLSPSLFSTSLKVELLQAIYPLYFWLLFGLSLLSIAVYVAFFRRDGSHYFDLLLYILCIFILYFLPIGISYRLEFYARVFLAVFISGLALFLDNGLPRRIKLPIWHGKLRDKKISLGVIASLFLLIITIAEMYGMFIQYSPYAYISKDEYDATVWIKNNVPSTAYILTDPSSGYVIRGLTLRNASTYFILPDGRMPADSSALYPALDDKIRGFFSAQPDSEWTSLKALLQFDQIYIVITTRTVSWALSNSDIAITHPMEGVEFSSITSKFTEPQFHEMYASNTIRIYKPN